MVDFVETMGQAQVAARRAMESMSEHGIIPSPTNFRVWYIHHSHRVPDLSRDIERLVRLESNFSPTVLQSLHDKYLGGAEEVKALAAAGVRIEATLEQLVKMLSVANRGTEVYGAALQDLNDQFDQTSGEMFHDVMASMLVETQKMLRLNRKMGSELSEASLEITKLRADLDSVRSEARTDGLTGISNRKVFDTVLCECAVEAEQEDTPLSLMMLDVDLFKRFNDTHGHQMGDQVLKLVARTITNCARSEDTVSRYGGEEFAVVLPRTSLHDAVDVGERIRRTVANKRITNRRSGNELGRITLSTGVAQYVHGESLSDFVQRADRALYMAKRLGRNQVVSQNELG